MGAFGIVVNSPCFNQFSGCRQGREEVLIEALISEAPVKAFDKAVLHGFTWCDVMPFNLCHFRMAFEVSSVPLSLTIIHG